MSGAAALTTPGYDHRGLDELFRLARADPLMPRCERFFFVRHGETDGNHARIFQSADQPLNARGLAQAEAASEVLKAERIGRIVASTMARAWVTAEMIAKPHGLTPEPEEGLRERWFGDLVGTPSHDHDWRHAPPNGEALDVFVRRARQGIKRALSLADAKHSTLVGHGGILYVLGPALGIDLETRHLANCTPLLFERSGGGWRARCVADVGGESDNVS
jgi:glucosyl-3-phosphoglycerate phosphatase